MAIHSMPMPSMGGVSSMPRFRTGLRLQTGAGNFGKPGLAHMVDYLHMAAGGGVPSLDSEDKGILNQLHQAVNSPSPSSSSAPAMASAIQGVANQGTGQDTQLAHFSPAELQTFDQLRGGPPDINPNTGLPQYGWLGGLLTGLLRAGMAIGGGILGGPLGAAAGSGIATKATGGSWTQALEGAALSGIGSEVGGGISGQGWNPTSNIGGTVSMGGTAGSSLGNAALSANAIPQSIMSYAGSGAGIGAGLGALSAGPNASSGGTGAIPQLKPFSVRPMYRTNTPYQGDPNKYGFSGGHQFYANTNPPIQYGDPNAGSVVDYSGGGYARGGHIGLSSNAHAILKHIGRMARGGIPDEGSVSGPGGGQDDLIDAKLSSGEHIVTSREISALGDGDNAEGQRRMYSLRKQILQKGGYKNTNPHAQTKPVRGIGALTIKPRRAA